MSELWRWFLHVTGSDNVSGEWYGFWSGFGGDLSIVAALFLGVWRLINCHADGCKRPGLHHVPGTTFKTCRKHHPTGGNTVEHIHGEHRAARR